MQRLCLLAVGQVSGWITMELRCFRKTCNQKRQKYKFGGNLRFWTHQCRPHFMRAKVNSEHKHVCFAKFTSALRYLYSKILSSSSHTSFIIEWNWYMKNICPLHCSWRWNGFKVVASFHVGCCRSFVNGLQNVFLAFPAFLVWCHLPGIDVLSF